MFILLLERKVFRWYSIINVNCTIGSPKHLSTDAMQDEQILCNESNSNYFIKEQVKSIQFHILWNISFFEELEKLKYQITSRIPFLKQGAFRNVRNVITIIIIFRIFFKKEIVSDFIIFEILSLEIIGERKNLGKSGDW